ncbi:MAG TPA: hypothetical protein VGU66_20780 [Candidatus Elarobacter sp.]|nr:hypothetical protein [Candidatus Elarobacter sp.]
MKLLRRAAVMTTALFVCASALASADPVDVTLAVTVNALSGQHEVNGGHSDKLTFAPLPLAELTLRRNAESLRIEGLPPVTFGYSNTGDGALSTRLSIVNATFRHTLPGGWFAGAGQTIYNQMTTYVPVNGNFFYTRGFVTDPIVGSEAQYSRVTGARFEIGRIAQYGRNRVEWWAAANPRMRGVQYTRIPTVPFFCTTGNGGIIAPAPPECATQVHTFADPENASQVDLSARVAHRISKNGEVLLGLRYLNYCAHYDDFGGQLADRNVGFAPTLGYRIKL